MKKKLILILSLVALLSCIFVVSASAEAGYSSDLSFYDLENYYFGALFDYYDDEMGVVIGSPQGDEEITFLIHNIQFNKQFFQEHVIGRTSVDEVVESYLLLNNVENNHVECKCIFESSMSALFDDIRVNESDSSFAEIIYFFVEQQFGGWLNDLNNAGTPVLNSFSQSLNDYMTAYQEACTTFGTAATYEGFNEYIEQNATSNFKANYNDNMKAFAQDMFSAGASSSTSSGGSTGGSSGSSGSGGSPNIPDDELGSFTGDFTGAGANGCTICGGGSDSLGCQHYQNGYAEGYDDALRSDTNKSNFQKAFDQGYYYANSEDFSTTIQNRIEESKDSHIFEYKQSTEFTEYLLSEEFISSENHSKVIANYCNTQEFVDMLLENQSIGMNNFKASDEYAAILAAERLAGKDDGYQLGLEEGSISGYERGVDDGYAMFRGSDLFNQTLNQWYQNGYHDGVDDSTEDGPSIVGLISVVVVIAGVLIAAVLINLKFNKKKSSKRK